MKKIVGNSSGAVSLKSRWSYALTMPVFLTFFSYLMVGPGFFHNWKTFVGAILLNGTILTGTFAIQSAVTERIAARYAGLDETLRRICISVSAHAVLSAVFLSLCAWLYIHYRLFGSTLTFPKIISI